MIKENYEDEYLKINIITVKFEKDLDLLIEWLCKKKNVHTIFDSSILSFHTNKPMHDIDYIQTQLFLIFGFFHDNYHYQLNNMYFIVKLKNKEISMFKFDFKIRLKKSIPIKADFYKSRFFTEFSNYLNDIDKIYLYETFATGDIFSKNFYKYEVNSFYMDSLKSYKSSDKNRTTFLKNEVINEEHSVFTEFYTNYSDNYNSSYAYIDFLNMYFESESTVVYYMENCVKGNVFIILDLIDEVYCKSVLNQQDDIKKIIENNIRIPENENIKGSVYSFKDSIHRLKKQVLQDCSQYEIDTYRQLNIYLKNAQNKSIKSYKDLWVKYEEKKLTKVEEIFFNEIVSKYPEYEREDYYRILRSEINNITTDIDTDLIVDSIFGKKSNLYYKNDKQKRFFKKVKNNFSIYHDLNENSQSLKYYFSDAWKDIVIKMRNALVS